VQKSNVKNAENVIRIVAKEVMIEDTKVKTVKVDALRETTEDKTTAMAEIGSVLNVRIIISHSDKNAIVVVKPVALVEDVVLDKTTGEVETKDTKIETGKVDALRETTEGKTTAMAEIGIVQNVEIIISHSVLNVIPVDFQKAVAMTVVAAMTDTEEMIDAEEMTVVEKRKCTPITIGIALNVTIQISHSDRNVIAVKHLAQAAVEAAGAAANVETMVDDHHDGIAAEDHLNEMTEGHLDVMTVEDLLNAMTDHKHLDAMMVQDLHDTKELDLLDVMAETVVVMVAGIKAEAHTVVKTEHLNASQENLGTLESHVEMDQAMHITARQSR
jgi:hypothetical protein